MVTLGFLGMLFSAMTGACPLWVMTALLFLMGRGFAPCSLGTLLGARGCGGVPGRRGIVTSGIAFFRNFGGAMGVGLFGGVV